jgi:hypothetical protein
LVAECERVERCLYVNLLLRRRWVLGDTGDEAKGWEEDMVQHLLLCHCSCQWLQYCVQRAFLR